MAKKLYVGNLSYATTEDELRTLFSEVGTVASVAMITDRATGQPKGFSFVEMETEAAAQQAIQKLDGREVAGRTITVAEARPPRERSFGGGDDRGGYGGGGGGGSRGGSSGGSRGGSSGGSRGGERRGRY